MATASRPGKGILKAGGLGNIGTGAIDFPERTGRTRDGTWRSDRKFRASHGVRIMMRRENGITKGDVLKVPLRFQAPALNNLARTWTFSWATYDTIRVGQRARLDGKQLTVIDVDTILMNWDTADAATSLVVWDDGEMPDPQRLLKELRYIEGTEPGSQAEMFRLVLSDPRNWGPTPLINMISTLTNIQATQNPGEPGTEYVTLSFQQWPEDDDIKRKQRPVSHGASSYTLKDGDTLYEIAKNSPFHAASAWQKIAKANGITGVSPNSASDLAAWAKKHHKTALQIPAVGRKLAPVKKAGS